MEAAPGASLTARRPAGWRAAGINRVSLGVQSFVRAGIARAPGASTRRRSVAAEVALLRAAGIGNFNIDLIAGLPGQTLESWRESLDWVERLEAPHVSVYMLEVDEDSRLGREMLLGGNALRRAGRAVRGSDRRVLRDRRRAAGARWGSRATRFRTSRGRASNRATI